MRVEDNILETSSAHVRWKSSNLCEYEWCRGPLGRIKLCSGFFCHRNQRNVNNGGVV